jgi:outer membrane protein assembly factor BamC
LLIRPPFQELRLVILLSGPLALGACSTVGDTLSPAKVDYHAATVRAEPLDIPPDLTQLARDPRYQPSSGQPVSAAAIQASQPAKVILPTPASAAAASAPVGLVAPLSSGAVRIERSGNQRWLVIPQTPEQLWPQLRAFWPASGFKLVLDKPELGVMETDWAENRTKLPQDAIRRTIGKLFDGLYDSGQRDRFRLRIERSTSSNSTEVYLSHRAAVEVRAGQDSDRLKWEPAGADAQLENEMLARLMLYLAPPTEMAAMAPAAADTALLATSTAAVEKAPETPARARLLNGRPAATLQVDDDFSRAWRRVGVALDRNGFTVEDRDRGQGLYYVRYVDPKLAGKEEPGFFSRVFGAAKKEEFAGTRYRIGVQAEGKGSVVAIFDAQGAPQNTEAATNIVKLLLNEMR